MRKNFFSAMIMTGAMLMASCSTTKYVPEGEYLLNRVKIKTEGDYREVNKETMRSYVRQMPNQRWFSLYKLPLATYSLSGRDSTKWVNRFLKSIGDAPVIYDSTLTQRTLGDLEQQLRNTGFLNARVGYEVERHGKKVDLTYVLKPGEPYFIYHMNYDIRDSAIARILKQEDANKSLIREGMNFDVSRLDAERKRITTLLSDSGYWRFHKDFITYQADTISGSRQIDLTMRRRRNQLFQILHQSQLWQGLLLVSSL